MSEKKFSEASDSELWADFRNWRSPQQHDAAYYCPGDAPFTRAVDHLFDRINDPWCCNLSRRYRAVVAKDGTRMRINFCPSCGRKLYL